MAGLGKASVAIGIVALAAALGFVVGNGSLLIDNGAAKHRGNVTDSSRLDRLEKELSQLTGGLEDQTRQVNKTGEGKTGEGDAIGELTARIDELAEVVARLQDANVSRRSNDAQSGSPSGNYNSELSREELKQIGLEQKRLIEDTFANETPDEIWANSMSVEIEEAFQRPELSAGRLAYADCRSTMCRVEVLHDTLNSTELFEFQHHLITSLAEEFTTGYMEQVEGPDGPRTLVHFVRKGEQLPQLENAAAGFGPGR